MITKKYIEEMKHILKQLPKAPWDFSEGNEYDHWEIWSSSEHVSIVHDDSGVEPDINFLKFIVLARTLIEDLIDDYERRSVEM